jgi:hypothetical protein
MKQEEPKQIKCYCGHTITCDCEPKQETLEEAAEKYASISFNKQDLYDGFIAGAKWQAERMYSEEDMREAFIAGGNSQIEEDDDYGTEYDAYMEEWFEQFKKK